MSALEIHEGDLVEGAYAGFSIRQSGADKLVGATGFEPATSWSQTKCSSQAELRSEHADSEYLISCPKRNAKVGAGRAGVRC